MFCLSPAPNVSTPSTCWGLSHYHPFLRGCLTLGAPLNLVCCMYGFALIAESSRYMSPYPQSTPRGAGSRCGGRLPANNYYKIVVIVSSQESQQKIIIVRFFTMSSQPGQRQNKCSEQKFYTQIAGLEHRFRTYV